MRISDWSSDVCSSDLVVEAADEIDDRVAALDRARDAGRLADIHGNELHLPKPPQRFQEGRLPRFALRDADARAARQQLLHDIAADEAAAAENGDQLRSEEHTSELQSLMRISYAVFCLKKKITI